MAPDIEKNASHRQRRSPSDGVTNKKDGITELGTRRGFVVFQFLELFLALITLSLGLVAFTENLANGWVFTLLGCLTLLVVPVELILEHTDVRSYTHWMTIGPDIILFLMWIVVGPSAVRCPPDEEGIHLSQGYLPKHVYFITLMLFGALEVLVLFIHIVIRIHAVRMAKLVQVQVQAARTPQRTKVNKKVNGEDYILYIPPPQETQRPRSPTLAEKDKGAMGQFHPQPEPLRCSNPSQEHAAEHPRGHRMREFSPEGLYQRSLQKTYEPQEEVEQSRGEQQVDNSQNQSSLAIAVETAGERINPSQQLNDSTQKPITPMHKLVDQEPTSSSEQPNDCTSKVRESRDSHKPVGHLQKQADIPQITIKPASTMAKAADLVVTLVNAQGGCGCADGTEEREIEVVRTGEPPVFERGVHPLRMNPYMVIRKSPLREVESASYEFRDAV